MSTADIAKKLKVSEATVRVQKANALKILKKAIRDQNLLVNGVISAATLALLELMFGR